MSQRMSAPLSAAQTADVHQRHRAVQPRGDEQAQHAAMIELGLRIGREGAG